jgi:hypothetical protein
MTASERYLKMPLNGPGCQVSEVGPGERAGTHQIGLAGAAFLGRAPVVAHCPRQTVAREVFVRDQRSELSRRRRAHGSRSRARRRPQPAAARSKRLSAGHEQMNETPQALCLAAGANSIFYGDTLLTTANPQAKRDRALLDRLGLRAQVTDGAKPPAQRMITALPPSHDRSVAHWRTHSTGNLLLEPVRVAGAVREVPALRELHAVHRASCKHRHGRARVRRGAA